MSEKTPAAEATTTPPANDKAPEAAVTPPADGAKDQPKPQSAESNKGSDQAKVDTPAEAEKPRPPEKYELKTREGSQLLKSDLEEIEAHAKAQGLSQADAQKLVEGKEAVFDQFSQRQQQAAREQMNAWKSEVAADKEIAGPGGKMLKENIELAHRAMTRFADDSFKKVLNETGLGNNPHLIRTFLRIGKGMAEDKAVLDGTSSPPPKKTSREEKLFPTHFQNKE